MTISRGGPPRAAAPARRRDGVVRELTGRIVSGAWPVGYLVPTEAELGALLGISRTALREGVGLLVDRGLLIVRQGKGTVVAPQAQWDLLDPLVLGEGLRHAVPGVAEHVLDVRRQLEPLAIGLAAERATPAERAGLERLVRQLREHVDDLPAYIELASRFHEALCSAAGNPLLARMLAPIHAALRIWRGDLRVPAGTQQDNHRDHERILAAVRVGHRVAAADAAAAHLSTVFEADMRAALAARAAPGQAG